MLDHPLNRLYARSEDREEDIFVNFIENRGDRVLKLPLLVQLKIELSESFLDMSEEEEVTWSGVGALGRMRQSFRLCRPDTFLGSPGIVGRCIVQMEHEPFQRLPTPMRSKVSNQTWPNGIIQECRVRCHPFEREESDHPPPFH
jgi:hypothetical protein